MTAAAERVTSVVRPAERVTSVSQKMKLAYRVAAAAERVTPVARTVTSRAKRETSVSQDIELVAQ